MRMGDKSGSTRLLDDTLKVIGKIGTQRSDPHGSSISHRTLAAKCGRSGVSPVCSAQNLVHLNARHAAIAAVWIAFKAPCKTTRQSMLINAAKKLEYFD